MWDYISGFIFLIWMIIICYLFGYSIRKEQHFTKNLLTGYIGYSFIMAIGLMVIELLDLPWKIALIYFFISVLGIVLFIVQSFIKNKLRITIKDFKSFIKENYFLFIIVLILLFISFISFNVYWLNNHLDDGYYLSKIVKMPYVDNPNYYNYSVNCSSAASISYKINTGELEASIYIYLLKINVFVFCRLFLNFFNYLLLCSSISVFADIVCKNLNLKSNRYKYIQYITCVVIFFGTNMDKVYQMGFMHLVDHWQFVTAMYLGSSIPRTMGILWLLIMFVGNEKITIQDLIKLFILSVVLMSKSTIALPIIVLTSFVLYLVVNLKFEKNVYYVFIPLLIYIIVGLILPNKEDIQGGIYKLFMQNVKTLPFIVSTIVLIISFAFRKKIINRINIILVIILGLMLIPEVNDVFETFSVFNFVANRMFTTLMYTFYITAFTYVAFVFIDLTNGKMIKPIFMILTCLITAFSCLTYTHTGMSVKNGLKTIIRNNKIAPNSTLELGSELDEISQKYGTLKILSPEFVVVDSVYHPLATILTTVSNDTVSYSAIPRYPVDSNEKIATFKNEYQEEFTNFNNTKSIDDFNKCIPFIDLYNINSFILTGDTDNNQTYGDFSRIKVITDPIANVSYSIYVKA